MKIYVPLLLATALLASEYYYKPKIPAKYTPNNGRVLAATMCFQCHGSFGVSKTKWDSIVSEELKEFYKNKHPIMKAQRKAFNKKEIKAIFSYLHSLKAIKIDNEYYENEDYEKDEHHEYENDD